MVRKHDLNMNDSEVLLELDSYDDLFSDFDPRHYSSRALSVDFLDEANRACQDKNQSGLKVKFILPRKKRNIAIEKDIMKRFEEHFSKHLSNLQRDKRRIIRQGVIFTVLGFIFMFMATIVYKYGGDSILSAFLVVLLEPGSWFLFWEGLDIWMFESKKINPKIRFYHMMNSANIVFSTK